MTLLPVHFVPSDDCVLCGRGKACKEAEGNRRFKYIVNTKLDEYLAAASRLDKTELIDQVISQVRQNCGGAGGFIKQHPDTQRWYEVGDFLAKEKTAQQFRDALHEHYSSSNPSKRVRNRKKRQLKSPTNASKSKTKTGESESASSSPLPPAAKHPPENISIKAPAPTQGITSESNLSQRFPGTVMPNLPASAMAANFDFDIPIQNLEPSPLLEPISGLAEASFELEPTPIIDGLVNTSSQAYRRRGTGQRFQHSSSFSSVSDPPYYQLGNQRQIQSQPNLLSWRGTDSNLGSQFSQHHIQQYMHYMQPQPQPQLPQMLHLQHPQTYDNPPYTMTENALQQQYLMDQNLHYPRTPLQPPELLQHQFQHMIHSPAVDGNARFEAQQGLESSMSAYYFPDSMALRAGNQQNQPRRRGLSGDYSDLFEPLPFSERYG